jgi:hypothetical protein
MSAIRILLYGSDFGLLASRARVLECAGYVVHVSSEFDYSQEIVKTTPVDMCILCQSLTYEQSLRFFVFASRVSPNMKMLRLSPDDLPDNGPDNMSDGSKSAEVLSTFVWPSLLIETVAKMTGSSNGNAGIAANHNISP